MEMTTRYVSVNMELLRRNTERKIVPIDAAITFTKRYLFSYNGRFSNYLIFGGVDNEGPHIRAVYPHGSADKLPFATMGSGSLAAISIFESRWEPDMSQEDAIKLVCDATNAGVYNDLGSGYGVDIVVIRKDFHKMLRGVDVVEKTERKLNYTPKRGTTGVLTCSKIEIEIEEEEVIEHDKMDLD